MIRGCSGVLGFAVFAIVILIIVVPTLLIVDNGVAAYALIIVAVILGWFAATRTDRALRRWIRERGREPGPD